MADGIAPTPAAQRALRPRVIALVALAGADVEQALAGLPDWLDNAVAVDPAVRDDALARALAADTRDVFLVVSDPGGVSRIPEFVRALERGAALEPPARPTGPADAALERERRDTSPA